MTFPPVVPLAPPILKFENVKLGYGDTVVLKNVNGNLLPDDRIALLGANGNGKSTFAHFLAGSLAPLSGHVYRSNGLRVGYFHQHHHETLDLSKTPFEQVKDLMGHSEESKVRALLGRFGFSREKADMKVSFLSGGEKARLMFCLLSVGNPHVLILDEPTNHLDMDMRESLIMAINEFEGAVVLIAHDWHLIKHTADQLWLVSKGTVEPFDGTIDDYKSFVTKGNTKPRK